MVLTAHSRSVLLIAADSAEADLVRGWLSDQHQLVVANDRQRCLELADTLAPDAIVLAANMEGDQGWNLCQRLGVASNGDQPPILLLVEEGEQIDAAFAAGAADALTRPLHPRLLRERVNLLLRARHFERQVQLSDQRWQQSFVHNHAIQLLIDPQSGAIVDANPAASHFYGYPREQLRQMTIQDIDLPQASAFEHGGMDTLFNFRHKLASGELRDVKVFSNPIEFDGRRLVYSIIFDNTKRRQAEAAEVDQRALAAALQRSASIMTSTLNQDEVLDRILENIGQVVPYDSTNIMLIRAGVARIVRWRGYDEHGGNAATIEGLRFTISETRDLRWMVEHQQPIAIRDVKRYTGWIGEGPTNWIRSHVSAPIRIGAKVIGFLSIDSARANQYADADAERLQAFADQAAIAIRNADLYNRVRRQAQELELRVEQRTAELDYERRQLRAILDGMTEGVAYTEIDENSQIQTLYINHALTQITGYDADEWRAQSVYLLQPPQMSDDDFGGLLREISSALELRGVWHREVHLRRKDGTAFDASMTATRVIGPNGHLSGAVSVLRDISAEKALQEQKAQFVAYASHELRTPITNLKTRLYLMRKQPERVGDHLVVLEEVADRMRRLVEDLLDMSRFERGVIALRKQRVVLQDLACNVTVVQQPEAEQKCLELSCEVPPHPIYVEADPERLVQVITNLVTNAINYTPSGGSVIVRCSYASTEDGQPGYALVEVQDTGIGIEDNHLPYLFQPFYRVPTQVEGMGLGLSIAREIIHLHGGEIGLDSEPGFGSCVSFWLPCSEAPRALIPPNEAE